jgi:hypothetical protein
MGSIISGSFSITPAIEPVSNEFPIGCLYNQVNLR